MKTSTHPTFQILLSCFLLLGLLNPLGSSAVAAARPAAPPQAALAPAAVAVQWCLAGSLNGWNNASTPLYDDGTHGDLFIGDGVFSVDYTIPAAGRYEWKIVECGNWNNAYPADNAWVNTGTANQVVKFTFDTNDHSADAGAALLPAKNIVNAWDSLPAGFTAVGDFQGWNNADPTTALTNLGHGLYRLAYPVPTPGSYIGKVTATGTWDSFGADGRSTNAKNLSFTTTTSNEVVIFLLDTRTGRLTVTNNHAGNGNWCLAGSLNGWNNASTPLNDNGSNGDLIGGDGVFSLDYTVPAAGRYEWKIVECGNWNNAYPAANAWVNTSAANQVVKFTFDTNDHSLDAGLALLPAKNIVNAWDSLPASFTAVGDFQGWNNANPSTALTNLGSGLQAAYIPVATAGSYIGKVTTTGAWDAFGADGRSIDAQNVGFQTHFANDAVLFLLDSFTGRMAVIPPPLIGHAHDNNVEWDGLRHDSRDLLYRTPGGAVPAGTPVILRFRTFHNDVTSVKVRVYSLNASAQKLYKMDLVAADVSCYQASLAKDTCDFWATTLDNAAPDNLWYRFIIQDGTSTAYYADNTPALDGGLGSPSADPVDNSYALMVYDPQFSAPSWASNAVIYQIFPDRFRNGNSSNDPKTGDVRYDDPVLALPWGTLPEGYCRDYADAATNCPWRFDANPPSWSPTIEAPRGRDYFGGDLIGVTQSLGYLKSLGVNTLYLNPIFTAKSNHRYDTANYLQIDPALGTQQDFDKLVSKATSMGFRLILDGVFNHMSSDSPFFDRYHHYATVGACESPTSTYRSWFYFHDVTQGTGTCTDSLGQANSATYDGWFGFDSIPVLNKTNPAVQAYFISQTPNSVSNYWLNEGATGWRLDVMGDSSFPTGYWETFRQTVKQTKSDALIVGELWQKDSTLLRFLRGDRADSTMNYRLRDAVIGLLDTQNFDSKGFADSGHPLQVSEVAARLQSIREDYPDTVYYSLMNLLDSHDTERLLWTLTPGPATTASKELNADNLAAGKRRLEIASLIQYTLPGAPTVYYGDEAGMDGASDPDDRRTYPWADTGGKPDRVLQDHYRSLSALRSSGPAFVSGDFKMLLADDANNTLAFGRKTPSQAALILVNRSDEARTMDVPLAGYIPDGFQFGTRYGVGNTGAMTLTVTGGKLSITLNPLSAWTLATGNVDLQPAAAPTGLHVTAESAGQVGLAWNAVSGAMGYNLYRSPVTGGGWVKVNDAPLTGLSYTDSGLRNARNYFYVVTSLDDKGNESGYSNEAVGMPHYVIGWANLQWPPTLNHTISVVNATDNVYGQVWIDGVTVKPGPTDTLMAQLGFGPAGSNPAGNAAWAWVDAVFNTDAGNNDEYKANLLPDKVGSYDYVYRYSTTNGRDWLYADLNGPVPAGSLPANPGKLTVNPSSDTIPPAVPTGLIVTTASPGGIGLAWNTVTGDPTLYGYEVLRSDTSGGPYTKLALVTAASYLDTDVVQGATYYYVVRAVDLSFNISANSTEVAATADLRTVTVNFNVTVPASTDGTGRSVFIAGTLSRLNGGLPDWNPGGVALTRVDATHWTITLTGVETTQIEYKYTLGDWDHVEKDAACGEIGNRQLTLSYGSTGTQTVNDTVLNWRNVSPCGN